MYILSWLNIFAKQFEIGAPKTRLGNCNKVGVELFSHISWFETRHNVIDGNELVSKNMSS